MRAIIIDRIALTAAVCAALFMLRCADLSGGGGSEAGNARITGRVLDSHGSPAGNVVVTVLPSDFDPVRNDIPSGPFSDTTGSDGTFGIAVRKGRTYTVQAVLPVRRTRALTAGLVIGDSDITAPQCTLKVPGAVKVMLPEHADRTHGYMYVPGTSILAFLNNDNDFAILDSVPAGTIPAIAYSSKSTSASTVLRYDVPVVPGDTTVIGNPSWKYARRLFLNTAASGAQVTGAVMNFPLLIRLNSGNFDFSQAQSTGADIRFSKPDNTPLPYEIERWDAVAGLAEIWVKVDTVYGNNNTRSIIIYWGNSGAIPASSGAAVFDTANGFTGVWHLGDNNDSISDATGHAFDGEKYGSTTTPGVIGNSASFTNGNFMRVSGLLNRPSNVTLSAWVRSDTSAGRGQDIVSIGDAALIRFDDVNGFGTGGFYHDKPVVNDSMYGRTSSGRYLSKTGWHYLAFSIDAATGVQTLYIDGVKADTTQDVNPIYYSGVGTDTYIGKHGNGKTSFNFIGQIDEVRVNGGAVDPDWIKLCFMNQKSQDALVVW